MLQIHISRATRHIINVIHQWYEEVAPAVTGLHEFEVRDEGEERREAKEARESGTRDDHVGKNTSAFFAARLGSSPARTRWVT